jgi:hypothetical protein
MDMNNNTSIHPTATAEDINRISNVTDASHPLDTGNNTQDIQRNTSNMTQTSHTTTSGHNNNTRLRTKDPEIISAVSSTPSEYGSSDGSHRSPHAAGSLGRPVADKNAFIQYDTRRHWQNTMTPAERAKRLAEEMDRNLDERRRSSADDAGKSLKIGGVKDIKLD